MCESQVSAFWRAGTKNRRRHPFSRGSAALALAAILLLAACKAESGAAVAFTVDGVEVERAELVYYMRDYSSLAAHEMETQYGVDSSREDFWTTDFDGLSPMDYLVDYTVRRIAQVKIEQLIAAERGVATPLTWSEQHRDMDRQNEERRKAHESGLPVYGRIELDFETYFADLYYGMRQAVLDTGLSEEEYDRTVAARLSAARITPVGVDILPEEIR